MQTAYSALLQARQSNTPFTFVQSAKLSRSAGQPLKGLQELEGGSNLLAAELKRIGIVQGKAPKSEIQMAQSKVGETCDQQ